MTKSEKQVGFYKAHTTEVTIDGNKHRVATIYLDNLKKSLGKKVSVSKSEQDAADAYLKEIKEREEESKKASSGAGKGAAKDKK